MKSNLIRKDPDGKKYYYHPDHLGSTTLVTNQTGAVVKDTVYEPYGQVFSGGGDRFQYTGKELDIGTGLEYYGARYYDPARSSQFIQPDPIIADIYDPQNLNRYAYVLNNPYKYTDPDGNAVVLVTNPLTMFGQSSLSSSQGAQLLGQSKLSYFRDLFRNSKTARDLVEKGFKHYDELPADSPIKSIGRVGGMAKQRTDDLWEVVRWDVGKIKPGASGTEKIPHINHEFYRIVNGKPEQVGTGVLNHFPIYSAGLVITFDQGVGNSADNSISIDQNTQVTNTHVNTQTPTTSGSRGSTTETRTTTTPSSSQKSNNNNGVCLLIICF